MGAMKEKKAQNFPPYCLSIAKPKAQSVWFERRSNPFGSKWALDSTQLSKSCLQIQDYNVLIGATENWVGK
jgi:hypothetical protein